MRKEYRSTNELKKSDMKVVSGGCCEGSGCSCDACPSCGWSNIGATGFKLLQSACGTLGIGHMSSICKLFP